MIRLLASLLMGVIGSRLGAEPMVTYTNPVVRPVAADPSVIRAADGRFYLYATQDDWADGRGSHLIPIFRSDDLIHWTYVGDVFSQPPTWKLDGGGLWAPDVTYGNGRYHLYYALSLWGDPNPGIGLATASSPTGPWKDLGRPVLRSSSIKVANSIDPDLWRDGDALTLFWGSFNGIFAVALDREGTRPVGRPVPIAGTLFEAPCIHRRGGFYYLFLSAGSCCEGSRSTYRIHVGRSRALLGPYVDSSGIDLRFGGGDVVVSRNEAWIGPGHGTVVTDDAGTDWLVYHAMPAGDERLENGTNRREALIDAIQWVEGWPVVHRGRGPSSTEQPFPVVKPR